MKKSLSLILAIAMVFSMFASVAFAADAETAAPLTTEAKYEALKEAKIFDGMEDGLPHFEQSMTRAQFAKVLVVLKGLAEDPAAAGVYTDLEGAGWATGFIGAATTAKLMEGVADGKFDPSSNVTTEQLATVLVRALGLAQSTEAVSGTVSDWAKGYVAAAVQAGLIPAATDYTMPALRSALVDSSYVAYFTINPTDEPTVEPTVEPTEAPVVDVKVAISTVNSFKVDFGAPVDEAAVSFKVERDGSEITVNATFADDKKSATLTYGASKLPEDDYTVTVTGATAEPVSVELTVVADDVADKIEILGNKAYVDIFNLSAAHMFYKIYNAYGEDITEDYSLAADDLKIKVSEYDLDDEGLYNDEEDSSMDPKNGVITIFFDDDKDNFEDVIGETFTVKITDKTEDGYAELSQEVTIAEAPTVASVSIDKLYNEDGDTLTAVRKFNEDDVADIEDFYLEVSLQDQYGNVIDKDMMDQWVNWAKIAIVEYNKTVVAPAVKLPTDIDVTDVLAGTAIEDDYDFEAGVADIYPWQVIDDEQMVEMDADEPTIASLVGLVDNNHDEDRDGVAEFQYKDIDGKEDVLVLQLAATTAKHDDIGYYPYDAGTSVISAKVEATGAKATFEVEVKEAAEVDKIVLSRPQFAPLGDKITIPYKAYDAEGNEVTDPTDEMFTDDGEMSVDGAADGTTLRFKKDAVTDTTVLEVKLDSVADKAEEGDEVEVTLETNSGNKASVTFKLDEEAKPEKVTQLRWFETTLLTGGAISINPWNVIVVDQYGQSIDNDTLLEDGYAVRISSDNTTVADVFTTSDTGNGTEDDDFTFGYVLSSDQNARISALERGSAKLTAELVDATADKKALENGTIAEDLNGDGDTDDEGEVVPTIWAPKGPNNVDRNDDGDTEDLGESDVAYDWDGATVIDDSDIDLTERVVKYSQIKSVDAKVSAAVLFDDIGVSGDNYLESDITDYDYYDYASKLEVQGVLDNGDKVTIPNTFEGNDFYTVSIDEGDIDGVGKADGTALKAIPEKSGLPHFVIRAYEFFKDTDDAQARDTSFSVTVKGPGGADDKLFTKDVTVTVSNKLPTISNISLDNDDEWDNVYAVDKGVIEVKEGKFANLVKDMTPEVDQTAETAQEAIDAGLLQLAKEAVKVTDQYGVALDEMIEGEDTRFIVDNSNPTDEKSLNALVSGDSFNLIVTARVNGSFKTVTYEVALIDND